jgi:hypothetical protein
MATIEQPPQYQPYGPAPVAPPPQNGLAVATLVLGIVTLCLSPMPFLNQLGIMVGLVGIALSVPALIIGVRRQHRVVMASIGLVLCIAGIAASGYFTEQFVRGFNDAVNSGNTGGVSAPAGGSESVSAGPRQLTFKLTGTARRADVNFSMDGSSGSEDSVSVPWTKTLTSTRDDGFASLSAHTPMGSRGDISCQITDETGAVLAEQTAASQGGQYGSAMVNCSAF